MPVILTHNPLVPTTDKLAALYALLIRVYLVPISLLIAYLLLKRSATAKKTPDNWQEIVIPLLATFGGMGNSLLLDLAPPSLNIILVPPSGLAITAMIGIILVMLSIMLSARALCQLDTNFGVFVQVREPVMTGMYAYVRHPMYTSYFGMNLGICLLAPRLPLVLLAVVYCGLLIYRARLEEAKLCEYSESYRQYKARTPMLIPRLRLFSKR